MKTIRIRISDNLYDWVAAQSSINNMSVPKFMLQSALTCWSSTSNETKELLFSLPSKEKESNEKERSKEKEKKEKGENNKKARACNGLDIPPTLEECTAYAASKEAFQDISVLEFYDYYDAKGWMLGKTPMKNWKSVMRNWVRRQKRFQGRGGLAAEKQLAAEKHEAKMRDMAHKERLEAAKRRESWGLCEERCANFREGKCAKGAKWPPQLNDRPIPPQECRNYKAKGE